MPMLGTCLTDFPRQPPHVPRRAGKHPALARAHVREVRRNVLTVRMNKPLRPGLTLEGRREGAAARVLESGEPDPAASQLPR